MKEYSFTEKRAREILGAELSPSEQEERDKENHELYCEATGAGFTFREFKEQLFERTVKDRLNILEVLDILRN